MKKNLLILLCFTAVLFMLQTTKVNAYSADCLPGGKNYISAENFEVSGEYYISINPFLVKPYTEYTFSMPRDYHDDENPEIEFQYFNNATLISSYGFDMSEYTYNSDLQIYYLTFTTGANINYMSIKLPDYANDILDNGFIYFQLEEGNIPTEYDDYIEGSIMDTESPYFQNTGSIISYVDSPITIEEVKSSLSAYDAIDGDLTSSIVVVSDGYTENCNVLGSYECVFEVSDSSSNVAQVTITIEVVDILKPVFSDIGTIQAVYPNTYSTEDVLAMLSASDNYDGDISNSIVLETDNYSVNANQVGSYEMSFSVTDSSNNEAFYTLTIEVVDNEGPIISGTTSIVIGYDTWITEDSVKDSLSVTDNYDDMEDLVFVKESDSYTSHHDELGSYSMIFSVTDSSGNKTTQEVSISVVDIINPVVYFNSSIIQVYNDEVLSLPDFIELLSKSNEIDGTKTYYITVKYDSYTKHATTPGSYNMLLDIKNDLGQVYTKQIEVKVIEKPVDYIYTGVIPNSVENIPKIVKYKDLIIGGSISVLAVASNIVWFFLFKKRK